MAILTIVLRLSFCWVFNVFVLAIFVRYSERKGEYHVILDHFGARWFIDLGA